MSDLTAALSKGEGIKPSLLKVRKGTQFLLEQW